MQIKIKIININGGKRENLNNSGMVILFWLNDFQIAWLKFL